MGLKDVAYVTVRGWTWWRNALLQGFIAALVLTSVLLLLITINRLYYNLPPVSVRALNPPHLGDLCPGDRLMIQNQVMVDGVSTLFYETSVLDETGAYNIPNTQRAWDGFIHPRPARFRQEIPWTVPYLEPGKYTRAFAVRSTDGDRTPIVVESSFIIKENCK